MLREREPEKPEGDMTCVLEDTSGHWRQESAELKLTVAETE